MTNISIRVSVNASKTRRSALKKQSYSTWKCAYCGGRGAVEDEISGYDKPCPACKGNQYWEANTTKEYLLPCNRCSQTGKMEDPISGYYEVCPSCKGSGWLVPRR
jgi:hypothetical protein